MNRLALGTAQFGLNYGVANRTGRVDHTRVAAILATAAAAGIDTLDTAIAYGDSEDVLGRAGVRGWRVITKLPPLPDGTVDVAGWVDAQVGASLKRLGVGELDAVLLHRPADLLGLRGEDYRAALARFAADGRARAIGVSIYDPSELDALWPVWRPAIVQAPLSVMDRRLLSSGWLEKLVEAGIRVHVRSVFLQGLLLMERDSRPAYFEPWRSSLDGWLNWCKDHGMSARRAALGYVAAQPGVERFVVGIDAPAQLDELLEIDLRMANLPPHDFASSDRALIEPSRWRLS